MIFEKTLIVAIALIATAGIAIAQQGMSSPSSKGYMDAMSKMQTTMPKEPTGDADKDFVRMMIPHHGGAIDMANVELRYGTDPELKKMAEKMIKDQKEEIAKLEKWLQKNGK